MPTPLFHGAVLAGGASRRMGRDKALIEVGGRTLVETAAHALVDGGATSVVVVGGDAHAIGELGLTVVPDRWPGEGPMGGVITALDRPGHEIVVVLGCDHPAAAGPAVASMVGALGDGDVAIPVVDGRRQLVHAAWRQRALPTLVTAFEAGERALHRAVTGLRVVEVRDGDACWYADVDRPRDLDEWS